jgi:hypothetical protein
MNAYRFPIFLAGTFLSLALFSPAAEAARVVVRVGPPAARAVVRVPAPSRRHVWVAAAWRLPPRPGALWVPGRWEATPAGRVWIPGHWS